MKTKTQEKRIKGASKPSGTKTNNKSSFMRRNTQKYQKSEKPNKADIRNKIRQQKIAAEEAERQRIKAEKDARIKEYKKQRLNKTKTICKRTQRGQPLMRDRMQLLLKQIEEQKRS